VLEDVITSKMRISLLTRFFLNPQAGSYLRELAGELGKSTPGVREELRHMREARLLTSRREGRRIVYRANEDHPLFPELRSMVKKSLGMDRIVESVLERLGDLREAWLLDDYARGRDTGIVDLVLVGDVNSRHLADLSRKTERCIGRKIRSLVLSREEFEDMGPRLEGRPRLLLWKRDDGDSPPSAPRS